MRKKCAGLNLMRFDIDTDIDFDIDFDTDADFDIRHQTKERYGRIKTIYFKRKGKQYFMVA